MEKEEKQRELAFKVAQATMEQIVAQVKEDMGLIRAKLPPPASAARETAAQMKYIRDRQASLDDMVYGEILLAQIWFWSYNTFKPQAW